MILRNNSISCAVSSIWKSPIGKKLTNKQAFSNMEGCHDADSERQKLLRVNGSSAFYKTRGVPKRTSNLSPNSNASTEDSFGGSLTLSPDSINYYLLQQLDCTEGQSYKQPQQRFSRKDTPIINREIFISKSVQNYTVTSSQISQQNLDYQ
jgi:hypothetical protein